jgi:hypothetical protein
VRDQASRFQHIGVSKLFVVDAAVATPFVTNHYAAPTEPAFPLCR